uniref:Uncharacterized protein n=1 Tax=Phlegmariurus squarrosus TaxID=73615 RepID=H9M8A1_PHLSQ|nr:hypothetical protein HusqMp133 [Phlegmariurus squarrosus]AEV55808.1 hypothetical protein HusqMp133 [Phlegmariurus squarrosus]
MDVGSHLAFSLENKFNSRKDCSWNYYRDYLFGPFHQMFDLRLFVSLLCLNLHFALRVHSWISGLATTPRCNSGGFYLFRRHIRLRLARLTTRRKTKFVLNSAANICPDLNIRKLNGIGLPSWSVSLCT